MKFLYFAKIILLPAILRIKKLNTIIDHSSVNLQK